MMNRNSLAIFIPLLLSSSVINAKEIYNKNGQIVNFYGKINPLYFYSYNNHPLKFNSLGNYTNLKIGIITKSYINDFVSGYMHIEYHPKFSSSYNEEIKNSFNKNNISLSYVGLDFGKWGEIDYGRSYGILYYPKKFTESYFDNTETIIFHKDDNFLNSRADDVVTYKNKDILGYFKGFNIILQHHNYCKNDESHLDKKYNDSWGAGLQYNSEYGFKIVGCTEINPYDEDKNLINKKDWIKSYGLGCYYSFKNTTVASFYGHSKNIERNFTKFNKIYKTLDSIEVSGKYNFQNGLQASIGYIKTFGKELVNGNYNQQSRSNTLNNHINLIMTYNFSKNFIFNVHYKYNLLNKHTLFDVNKNFFDDANNSIGTGMTYNF
ncbi:MAG: porin [Buchnera aphidicola (Periphyllus aceris)]|nr:porin [Buchnera aphidicola (Periphyllus aceris)]